MSRTRSRRGRQDPFVALQIPSRAEGSLGAFAGQLDRRIALHEKKEELHAAEALHHQAERDRHAAERRRLVELRESLGKTLAATRDLIGEEAALGAPLEGFGTGGRPPMTRMVAQLLESHDPAVPITPTLLAQALSETFAEHLRRPVAPRHVSPVLRRFAREGKVAIARPGTSHNEAVYRKHWGGE